MRETALRYLERDILLHVDMIECIRRELCEIVYAGEDGVLIELGKGFEAMLSCDSLELALSLPGIGDYSLLVLHQTHMKPAFCEKFGYKGGKDCWQGAYIKAEPLREEEADIRLLGEEYAEAMAAVYWNGDVEQMREHARQGLMYGIFENGELAGFIGMHPEGSIGLLEVLPQYRRRGYGEALERRYVNMELERGHVPYGQVFVGNQASRSLQEKLGMSFAESNICWVWKD